jgi:GxxExxY protein
MNGDSQDYKYSQLTDKVLKAFYKVYNALGYGFLEKVYENAMMIELKNEGLEATFQSPIKVMYENQMIGE